MVTQITDLPWSEASHPAVLHFMCRKTAVGVSMLQRGTDRRERRINVSLVGSIDISPCVQEKATGREGGNEVSVSLCACMSAVHGNQVVVKRSCPFLQETKLRKGLVCVCVCVCVCASAYRFTCF